MTGQVAAPRVVAIGGGHGLAVTLQSVRPWAACLTAVVSTADDGGSSGRLRDAWHVPGLGDVRRCLAALADRPAWAGVLERRFDASELKGHAVGNLLLLALAEELGDLQAACDEAACAIGIDATRARVVPATGEVVVLCGRTADGDVVEGQVSVASTVGIAEVWVTPEPAPASPDALEAIAGADLVVLGPGSLYTSVLAAAVVGDLRDALQATPAHVAYVANLRAEQAEARGYGLDDHLAALRRHAIRFDSVLHQRGSSLGAPGAGALGSARLVEDDLVRDDGLEHAPDRLGAALRALLG